MPKYYKPYYGKKKTYKSPSSKALVAMPSYAPKSYYGKNSYRTPLYRTGGFSPHREIGVYDSARIEWNLPTDAAAKYEYLLLNSVAQGSAVDQRKGKQIAMKNLRLSYTLAKEQAATVPAFIRIVVVYDTQTNGAVVTDANLWEDSSNQVISFPNKEYTQRFQILYDRKYTFGGQDAGSLGEGQYIINDNIQLKGRRVSYTDTSGAIATIATGSLILLAYSDGASTDNQVAMVGEARLYFYDD